MGQKDVSQSRFDALFPQRIFIEYRSIARVETYREGELGYYALFAPCNNKEAFSILRKAEVLRIEYFVANPIAERIQHVADGSKRISPMVHQQPLDILEEDHLRWDALFSLIPNDLRNAKEERTSGVFEASLQTGHTKGLAWKTSA